MGPNQSFVLTAMSSSDQENISFNTFTSGALVLEGSSVSAVRTVHSGKQSRLRTIIAKKTASFFDTVANQFNSSSRGAFYSPPAVFVASSGTLLNTIKNPALIFTGSNVDTPAVITIDVPVSGKLVDIRVWLELHHQSSSLPECTTPLGSLGIVLRPPNLFWNGWAHPIDNDRIGNGYIQDPGDTNVRSRLQNELWRDGFLLWEGSGMVIDQSRIFHSASNIARSQFASWDRDLGMRTVFSDSATSFNPRINYSPNISGNIIGAPNGVSSWGLGVCWTGSSGSPPAGWLSGPGGTAAVNEWPTTGSNVGASFIKPVYPLLDRVIEKIPSAAPGAAYPRFFDALSSTPIDFTTILGDRPGLRGTEISGTWQLMFSIPLITVTERNHNLWFRQARLEITYETGEPVSTRFPYAVPMVSGERQLYSVSGTVGPRQLTASLNLSTVIPNECEIGRSFGISSQSGMALQYRLTGSLADISGSNPGWLLSGPFGMPIIPESSASLVPLVPEGIVGIPFSDFLQPRRNLDLPQRLSDVASDENPQVRLRDLATAFVSSSAT